MKTYNIYRNLAWLNDLPEAEAERIFLSVGGSEVWARELTRQRPYVMLEGLFETAERVWFSMSTADRIEAFGKAASMQETNGSRRGSRKSALSTAAGLYREKFGFIFVLCDEGRSAAEVTAVCKARFGNSVATELQIAAEEHRKLIELRLFKLLEK